MHFMSCSFHALCLFYFCCFSYLSFLQSRLRLIIVIDSNKDILNINDINTLYPLRVATCIKNEFQNLQKGFKSSWRGLGYVIVWSIKFEIGKSDLDDSLFKKSWIVLWHYCVYSILHFSLFNTPIQIHDLIMSFNSGWQEFSNWVSRNFADIAKFHMNDVLKFLTY